MSALPIPGLDHGTSNSGIAVLEPGGPRMLKPNGVDSILPSAVYMDRTGRTLVGPLAYRAMLTADPKEGGGYTGYKLELGQDNRYEFAAARKVLTGPQLGALVLGELLKVYQQEYQAAARACVITVPAVFEQNAYEATREAARQTGLEHYTFVQEPIAAALAYGFTASDARAKWVIFDIGAGTTDISLVQVRDGELTAPKEANIGDKFLGGRKLDRELLAYVLGPASGDTVRWDRYRHLDREYHPLRARFALEGFSEETHRAAWGKLHMAVEQAKIELSRKAEAVVHIDGPLCTDERGRGVEVEIPVSRAVYTQLIAPDVERAVNLCHTLITRNRLTPKDIQKLVLIGGPTKTPFIKQVLADRLGIPLEDGIDPMTAVALGAAIRAAHLELPAHLRGTPAPAAGSACTLTLEYERSSRDGEQFVAGKVDAGGPAGGLSVEIKRADGLWSSGRLPVSAAGLFTATVPLNTRGRATLSQFTTTVLDPSGRVLATADEPQVWYQLPGGGVGGNLTNSLLVEVADNETQVLLKGNSELPAKGKATLRTSAPLRAGGDESLEIPVIQAVTNCFGGEDGHADCGVRVGVLRIRGRDIRRDLPAGSAVDVRMECNESQVVRLEAFLPALDEHFDCEFQGTAHEVTAKEVAERFARGERALRAAEGLQASHPLPPVGDGLDAIRRSNVLSGLAEEVSRAEAGELTSLNRANRRTLELTGSLNVLTDRQRPARIRRHLDTLAGKVSGQELTDLRQSEAEFTRAAAAHDAPTLKRLETSLDETDWRVRRRPIIQLFLCWRAFPKGEIRGTHAQIAAFDEMVAVLKAVNEEEEAGRPVSDDLLRRTEAARAAVVSEWGSKLDEWQKDMAPISADEERRPVLLRK